MVAGYLLINVRVVLRRVGAVFRKWLDKISIQEISDMWQQINW